MKIDYVEKQMNGSYKFYRIDGEKLTADFQKKTIYHEIPVNRISKVERERAIRNWNKRNSQSPTTIY